MRPTSMIRSDEEMLRLTGPLYDGLYEYVRRSSMLSGEGPPR
jgi:hypothetical protein